LLLTHYLMWADDPGESAGKATAVLWISSALAWRLVPVLARYGRAGPTAEEHVIAVLGGLELVAGAPGREAVIEGRGGGLLVRHGSGETRLQPGERLVLRAR
jgi:hypothetical protein